MADEPQNARGTHGEQRRKPHMCEQCGERLAFYAWPAANGTAAGLCVECSVKVHAIESYRLAQIEMLERHADHAADEIAFAVGMPPMGPRFRDQPRRPSPTVFQMTQPIFNNISVDSNSTVGAINTGTAHRIDVSISQIRDAGDSALSDAIRDLAQAVVSSRHLDDAARDEALQAIDTLASEAQKPADKRQLGVVRMIAIGLGSALSLAADVATLWPIAKTAIAAHFGVVLP